MTTVNPFVPGNGLLPPHLAGREAELTLLERILDDPTGPPSNILVSGLRGVGKTVLARRYQEMAADYGWVAVRREFSRRHQDEAIFAHAIVASLVGAVGSALLGRWLAKPRIGFTATVGDLPDGDLAAHLLECASGTLEDRLAVTIAAVIGAVRDGGFVGVVLLLDEFHLVVDDRPEKQYALSVFLEVMSRLQQEGVPIRLVLSGLPDLLANLVACKTYTERMFATRVLDHLGPAEARDALLRPMAQHGIQIEPAALDRIVEDTRGYPYFLQQHARSAVDRLGADIRLTAYLQHRPAILEQLDASFYAGRYAAASDAERELLATMALFGHECRRRELLKRLGHDQNYLNQILIMLLAKGLIVRTRRGQYAFALPLFDEFLKREASRTIAA